MKILANIAYFGFAIIVYFGSAIIVGTVVVGLIPKPSTGTPNNILFLGDSIVHGWQTEGAEVWRDNFASKGAVCLGSAGLNTSGFGLTLLAPYYETISPSHVVVSIGVNDLIRGIAPNEVVGRIGELRARMQKKWPSAEFIWIEQPDWMSAPYPPGHTAMLNRGLRGMCKENGDTIILATRDTYDGIHPNAVGYRYLADAILEAM